MKSRYKIEVSAHLNTGCTPEQAGLLPGTLGRIFEVEVLATSEPEACDLACEQVRQELDIPGSDSEAYSFLVRAVQVDPLETTEVDAQPGQPGKPPCPVCNGFGFIKDSDPEYLLRRCVQCDRFKDDDELLRFVWAKLTGASLDHPGEENENPPGPT